MWFQKSRVTIRFRHVQVSVSSRLFAQSLDLEDFGRDSSSGDKTKIANSK